MSPARRRRPKRNNEWLRGELLLFASRIAGLKDFEPNPEQKSWEDKLQEWGEWLVIMSCEGSC